MTGTPSSVASPLLAGWRNTMPWLHGWPRSSRSHRGRSYLFDSTPTMSGADTGDDRVVAVWGRSVAVAAPRDSSRQAGFIPVPAKWSHIGMDRGHFVAHAAGGGMDINFFPQAQGLNR